MARGNSNTVITDDVDVDAPSIEDLELEGEPTDVVSESAEAAEAAPKAPKKEPARGELPEGYVTPVGFAKILTDRGLHTNREGQVAKVEPQMVYSYIRNAPKDAPFPVEDKEDSLGKVRQVINIEAGLAWWEQKNARTAERKQHAAEKAAKKAEKASASSESTPEGEVEDVEVTEAE